MRSLKTSMRWLLLMLFIAGCGSSGGSDKDTGTLSLLLTDAPAQSYQAVYVTIEKVQVHRAAPGEAEEEGWITVASPQKTYNLLDLVNGVMEQLGTRELASGHYTQIRLILGDQPDAGTNLLDQAHPHPQYLVTDSGDIQELKVPSGYQTGIKLTHGFDLVAGLTVELVLDFDASQSVVQAGKSGQYLLKPTIKIIDTIDNAVISGTVADAQGNLLSGASVSVQVLAPEAALEQDKVHVIGSTRANEDGKYLLYVPPGQYTLAATLHDSGAGLFYGPACSALDAEYNTSHEIDFLLDAVDAENVEVRVLSATETVALSFRSADFCGDAEEIEVACLLVDGNGSFMAGLPESGSAYHVVAASGGKVITADVTAGSAVDIDFFGAP